LRDNRRILPLQRRRYRSSNLSLKDISSFSSSSDIRRRKSIKEVLVRDMVIGRQDNKRKEQQQKKGATRR
jgi:hypothetical protein